MSDVRPTALPFLGVTVFVLVVHSAGVVTLRVHGELDVASGQELCRVLEGVDIGAEVAVEVDLGAVTFIDCEGLRALLRSVGSARRRGRTLSVTRASACVRRLVRACGMSGALRAA